MSCSHFTKSKCERLKNGEFYYKGDAMIGGSRIVRHDSVQVVTDEKTGEIINERIAWMEPCVYLLYPYLNSRKDILESTLFPIRVEVMDITDQYYTVHLLSADKKADLRDTAWIVRLKLN